MKRKTGNWMVKITRLNADGTRDYPLGSVIVDAREKTA